MTRMSPQGEREVTASMIDVVHHGPIALVTLRRPPANAMNLELTEEIATDWRIAVKTQFLAGLTEVRVGVSYPVGAMEVVRQELRPDVARRLVVFGQNMTAAAVQAGVFDETVDPEALLERAMAKATEFAALPQTAFARSKRQLRSRACEAMEAAIAGAEPLLNGWLSKETIQAAAAVLARKGLKVVRQFRARRTGASIGGQTSSHSLRTASLALSAAGVPSNTMRPWPIT